MVDGNLRRVRLIIITLPQKCMPAQELVHPAPITEIQEIDDEIHIIYRSYTDGHRLQHTR